MEPRGINSAKISQRLGHDSAIWMAGLTQLAYKHRVDAKKMRANETGPMLRVNLTFRRVRVRRT